MPRLVYVCSSARFILLPRLVYGDLSFLLSAKGRVHTCAGLIRLSPCSRQSSHRSVVFLCVFFARSFSFVITLFSRGFVPCFSRRNAAYPRRRAGGVAGGQSREAGREKPRHHVEHGRDLHDGFPEVRYCATSGRDVSHNERINLRGPTSAHLGRVHRARADHPF